jgi:hypothetical protein
MFRRKAYCNGCQVSQCCVLAESAARAIVRPTRRGRHEIIPNFRGRMLCWMNRFRGWSTGS